uniref:Chitinase n=1 Tax=Serratia marcescens TaxID=615 RepID=Q59930_SERMA|nr:chitinase [Serratia marcescens]
MNKTSRTLLSLDLLSAAMFGVSQQANAHGYVESPASRAYQCKLQLNTQCGRCVQYEPQSVEGLKASHRPARLTAHRQRRQVHLLRTGSANADALEQAQPENPNSFTWKLTARHSTTSWRYFITKPNWDASQPLTRASFDLTPFCQFNDGGGIPAAQVTHQCNIPADRAVRSDPLPCGDIGRQRPTANAFYQAIDVNLSKYSVKCRRSLRVQPGAEPFFFAGAAIATY